MKKDNEIRSSSHIRYRCRFGRSKKQITEHIRNQLEEDCATGQITIKEHLDPFTGSKTK